MANVKIPLTFQIYKGSQLVRTEKLVVTDQIRIGKVSSANLKLEEEGVSRMHAEVSVSGDNQIHIIDLGSQKGTFVNGQKVQKQQLRSGDELKIGDVKLILTIGQPIHEQVAVVAAKPVEVPRYAAPRYVMPPLDLSQVEQQGTLSAEVQLVFQGAPLQVLNLTPARTVFVGDASGCEFFVPANLLGASKMPLVWVEEGSSAFSFCFTASARGSVSFDGGQKLSLSDLIASGDARVLGGSEGVYAVKMNRAASCLLELSNGTQLKVRAVASAKKVVAKSKLDIPILGYTAGSGVAAAMALALIFNISPDARSLDISQFKSASDLVSFKVQPPEEKKDEVPAWLTKDQSAAPVGEKGKAHKGPEGKMGKPNPKSLNGQYTMKGDASQPQKLAREVALDMVNNVGVVGLIKGGGSAGGAFASVFGTDNPNGSDAENIMGNLLGDRPGEGEGVYGLGLKGAGFGGFGDGEGTLGVGDDGIVGKGNKGNCQAGAKCDPFGTGGTGFTGHKAGAPDVIEGKGEISGALDKDTIRRVIRRAMPGIKFCYEQALLSAPELGGSVKVYFVIAPTGAVTTTRTVAGINSEVDACVSRKISQLSFPAPQGGGIVEVTYPFMFKAAGK